MVWEMYQGVDGMRLHFPMSSFHENAKSSADVPQTTERDCVGD